MSQTIDALVLDMSNDIRVKQNKTTEYSLAHLIEHAELVRKSKNDSVNYYDTFFSAAKNCIE
jgi:hypothetical protein